MRPQTVERLLGLLPSRVGCACVANDAKPVRDMNVLVLDDLLHENLAERRVARLLKLEQMLEHDRLAQERKDAPFHPVPYAAHQFVRVIRTRLEMLRQHRARIDVQVRQHLGAQFVMPHLLGRTLAANEFLVCIRRKVVEHLRVVVRAGQLPFRMHHHQMRGERPVFVGHVSEILRCPHCIFPITGDAACIVSTCGLLGCLLGDPFGGGCRCPRHRTAAGRRRGLAEDFAQMRKHLRAMRVDEKMLAAEHPHADRQRRIPLPFAPDHRVRPAHRRHRRAHGSGPAPRESAHARFPGTRGPHGSSAGTDR